MQVAAGIFSGGRRTVAAGAGLAACVAIAMGCGGSGPPHYLDVAKVREAIRRSILEQRQLKAVVVCPEHELREPHRFACVATTASRTTPRRQVKTPFLVTVVNDKGRVRYVGLKPPRPSR